jgi:hypothetical protein
LFLPKAVSSPLIQAEKIKVRSPQSLVALFLAGFADYEKEQYERKLVETEATLRPPVLTCQLINSVMRVLTLEKISDCGLRLPPELSNANNAD